MSFLSDYSAQIGLVVLVLTFIAFLMERRPPVVIAVVSGAVMLALGYLPPKEMLATFANSAPITIAAMFILTGALLRTGALTRHGREVSCVQAAIMQEELAPYWGVGISGNSENHQTPNLEFLFVSDVLGHVC